MLSAMIFQRRLRVGVGMDYEFSLIKPLDSSANKKIKKRSQLMEKIYCSYLLKRMPADSKEIFYMDVKGREITLPFTCDELQNLKEDYLEKLWNIVKMKYAIEDQYLLLGFPSKITKRFQMGHEYSNIFNYILFKRIFFRCLEENEIDIRDVRLVVLDSNNRKIEFILELLYKELNYLKIITKRQEYFKEFQEMIYDATGLVAETVDPKDYVAEPVPYIGPDVVIDLNSDLDFNYRVLEVNAVLFDMESSLEKRKYLAVKRKDLRVVYECEITYQGEKLDNNLAGMIYYGRYKVIQDFLSNKKQNQLANKLMDIGGNLQINNLKYI